MFSKSTNYTHLRKNGKAMVRMTFMPEALRRICCRWLELQLSPTRMKSSGKLHIYSLPILHCHGGRRKGAGSCASAIPGLYVVQSHGQVAPSPPMLFSLLTPLCHRHSSLHGHGPLHTYRRKIRSEEGRFEDYRRPSPQHVAQENGDAGLGIWSDRVGHMEMVSMKCWRRCLREDIKD